MGAGPGGSFISDVEIRYALERDRPGLYTYSIFEHQPDYPASVLGEARFCVKLNDFFDWMSVGPKWNKPYPKAQPGEHEDKYDFTADQFENPAFRMVQHFEERRLLVRESQCGVFERRPDQGGISGPSRH
jgi:rhamnogalacturonan endolyase